jgi:dTDP-3-amino-3,4,6-trideoxy-alpha-D-glucopyranose N,N-dimethyltransferase/N-dimethyltransferase
MRSAIANMTRHVRKGGLFILEPYFTPEQYWNERLVLDTVEDSEGKIARMYTTGLSGRLCTSTVHYLIGTKKEVLHFTEYQELALYTADEYSAALEDSGLRIIRTPSDKGPSIYLCTRD